jgi:ferrous iron transport protein B
VTVPPCDQPQPTPRAADQARARARPLVVLVGNPNTGKTTVFNRLTGANARIGNYPGITVERRVGTLKLADAGTDNGRAVCGVDVLDAPGAYSLTARSAEEQIAISAALGLDDNPEPQLVVAVIDAGQLVRNLYLVVQLIELEVPLVLAVNMVDEVTDNPPDLAAISSWLGVPCVPTNARDGVGIGQLRQVIAAALRNPPRGAVSIPYPEQLCRDAAHVAEVLPAAWRRSSLRDRALAIWALTSVDQHDNLSGITPELRARCLQVQAGGRDLDGEVIAARYAFLDEHTKGLFARPNEHPPKRRTSERIDRVLLHPLFGFVGFIASMLLLFQALFSWSDPLIGWIEQLFGLLQRQTNVHLAPGTLRDLLSEGVIGGVGNVLVFLPQILLLFLFVGLLEDSGYMARVAFLMDRIMKAIGLHGRAFVPMLSALACAVPAILATRTMERRRDRLLTMMVIPLVTCSARLPVYTLIIAALFPPTRVLGWLPLQGLLMVAMYLFSIVMTLAAAAVLGRTAIRARRVPLILELPPYRVPSISVTLKLMWERTRVFLKEAGTVILAATIVLWVLLSFPKLPADQPPRLAEVAAVAGGPAPASAAERAVRPAPPGARGTRQARAIEHSYAGRLGRVLEPVLKPLGFDWKIGVGIIGAFAAREVFISTMGLVYGMGTVEDTSVAPLRARMRVEKHPGGQPVYTPLVGLSLMVFFALSCQCVSTLAAVRRETRSWRWPLFLFCYMTALAWLASLLVYQGGSLLGF